MAEIRNLTLCVMATVLLTSYASAELGSDDPCKARKSSLVGNENTRIYGGTPAALGEFPYQIHLTRKFIVGSAHCLELCGGSIISDKWVLTAGHCVVDHEKKVSPPSAFNIRAGSLSRSGPLNSGAVDLQVIKVVAHPAYLDTANNGDFIQQDLALLQINGTFNFNKNIQPVKLADAGFIAEGPANATGWGEVPGGKKSELLLKVDLRILSQDVCRNVGNPYWKYLLCAGDVKGKGICYGDSGGPLTQDGVLVGVAHQVLDTCENLPNLFTGVTASDSRKWIKMVSGV